MADRTVILDAVQNTPELDTGAPVTLEFAVNLGALAADAWLELKGAVRLHDYIAHQTDAFSNVIRECIAEEGEGVSEPGTVAANRQAFVAGLMGRLQQHLLAALGLVTRNARTQH